MTLTQRISLLVAGAAAGLIALTSLSSWKADEVFKAANFANENTVPALEAISKLTDGFSRIRGNAYRMVLAKDGATESAAIAQLEKGMDDIDKGLKLYEPTIVDAKDKAMYEAVFKAHEPYEQLIRDAMALHKSGKNEAATELLMNAGANAAAAMYKSIDALTALNYEMAATGAKHAEEARRSGLAMMAGGGVTLLLVLGGFGFVTVRSVRRSSVALQTGANAVAEGRLDQPINVPGNDEFAQVGQAFNKVRDNVAGLVKDMKHMAAEHEAGDIDVVIDAQRYTGEYRSVAQGVNDMVGAHIAVNKMAMGVVAEFGRGNYEAPMAQLPGKKAFINDTIETVRGLLREADQAAQENLRIRLALEAVPSAVMVTDKAGVIRFANRSVLGLLRRIEPDLRKVVPHFSADNVLGQNFDSFHRNPAHQRGIVDQMTQPHAAQFKFGAFTIRLVASPISDAQGQRVGSIMEWVDRTAEVAAEEDVTQVVEAAHM